MAETRDFTGVFIPVNIWVSKELTPTEKMLLGEIDALSKKTGWCHAGREHFAGWLSCDPAAISYIVKNLEKIGFLEVVRTPGYPSQMRVIAERFYGIEEARLLKKRGWQKGKARVGVVNPIYGGGKSHLGGVVNPIYGGGKSHLPEIQDKENIEIEGKEKREIAPPPPPAGENFNFGAEKSNEPSQGGGAAGGPGGQPTPRGGNPEDWTWVDDPAPAHVTTYAVPTSETFEAAPGGPTYRAEVHAPAERAVVAPKAKTPKAQPQPRALEIPDSHAAVAPELTRLLCKKHYLQKSAERLAAEMGWLFSKPVAFAVRHIQDSLSSPKGAWAALDFIGCEDAFARWQKDERLRAQAQQGPGASQQTMQRTQSPIHQSPVFGERRL